MYPYERAYFVERWNAEQIEAKKEMEEAASNSPTGAGLENYAERFKQRLRDQGKGK